MKTLFSAASVAQAIESAKTPVKVKTAAPTTPLGSSIIRAGKVTETSQLDYVLIAGLGLSENFSVHVSQLVELATMAKLKLSAGRIKNHVKTNKVADLADGIVSVSGKLKEHYASAVKSVEFMAQVTMFSEELAVVIGVEQAAWARSTKKEQKKAFEDAHFSALAMNVAKVAKKRKAAK